MESKETEAAKQFDFQRMMLPDDANPAGNVHGGTILKMMETTGHIVATRHCNSSRGIDDEIYAAALVGTENCSFLRPMHIGDLCKIAAEVSHVGDSSIEVTINVYREHLGTGEEKLTNQASMWYVRVRVKSRGVPGFVVAKGVPALAVAGNKGSRRYVDVQASKSRTFQSLSSGFDMSTVALSVLTLPSDATSKGVVFGGTIMKLMDSAAGVMASRHCRSNVVTVSLKSLHLVSRAQVGELVQVVPRIVFTSAKSLEIEVGVFVSSFSRGKTVPCALGVFTFVSLDSQRKVQSVPPFHPSTPEEKVRFEAAEKRYLARKAMSKR